MFNDQVAEKLKDIKERNASQRLVAQIANLGVRDRGTEKNLMSAFDRGAMGGSKKESKSK